MGGSTMSTTTNLAINKKGTKVVIVGKQKFYNLAATTVQFVPVLTYLALKFDMFTFQNQGYAITGWGITGIAVIFLAMRSKLKDKLAEMDTTLGATWKRSKAGTVSLVFGLLTFLISVLATNIALPLVIFGGSTYASLLLYKSYDELSIKRKLFQKTLDEENSKKDFEQMQAQFLEIKTEIKQIAKL
jgi:hypothetical protein